MNENVKSQLDAELAHAGEKTVLSPQMLLLEQLRITQEKELEPMEFLFRLFGKPCFPRRELVAITGKAKSGKTFVTSMLMAESLTPRSAEGRLQGKNPSPTGEGNYKGSICQLPLRRIREDPLRVLWYDTEQSDESTQDILKNRIMTLIKTTTDLTDSTDINDHSCSISGNSCSKEKSEQSVSSVFEKQIDVFNVRAVPWKERRDLLREAVTRCKPDLVIVDGIRDLVNDIEQTFYFEVGDDGLPSLCAMPVDEGRTEARQERLPQLNSEYIVHDDGGQWKIDIQRLFADAMRGETELGHFDLQQRVMELSNVRSYQFLARLFRQAIEQDVIIKSRNQQGLVVYQAPPF